MTIPIDSTDAREQRELEAARIAEQHRLDLEHAAVCVDGWLGEDSDGRPMPCLRCRPHLADTTCSTCAARATTCSTIARNSDHRCCDACTHDSDRADRWARHEEVR